MRQHRSEVHRRSLGRQSLPEQEIIQNLNNSLTYPQPPLTVKMISIAMKSFMDNNSVSKQSYLYNNKYGMAMFYDKNHWIPMRHLLWTYNLTSKLLENFKKVAWL